MRCGRCLQLVYNYFRVVYNCAVFVDVVQLATALQLTVVDSGVLEGWYWSVTGYVCGGCV